MDRLNKAYCIVSHFYEGEIDQGGKPLLAHILYVASKFPINSEEYMVALLYTAASKGLDPLSYEELLTSSGKQTLNILQQKAGIPYMDYISLISTDPVATMIKIEELKHDLDISRLSFFRLSDSKRLAEYKEALSYLLNKSSKGE